MTTTPRGWYDDGHGTMRWWDGALWTEQVAEPDADMSREAAPRQPEIVAHGTGGAPDPVYAGPPTKPTKSKLWIVWVVLGVVVCGTIILAALLILQLVVGASGQAEESGSVTPTDPDQQAAVAAVERYDDAWQNADCPAYVASTTESFRTQSGLPDCSAFETDAEAFNAAIEDYEVAVTGIREESGKILVATTETYASLFDEDGAPRDEPTEESIDWVYVVVSDGDDWVIDDLR